MVVVVKELPEVALEVLVAVTSANRLSMVPRGQEIARLTTRSLGRTNRWLHRLEGQGYLRAVRHPRHHLWLVTDNGKALVERLLQHGRAAHAA